MLIAYAILSLIMGLSTALLVVSLVICMTGAFKLTVYLIHVHFVRLVNRLIFYNKATFKK